MLIVLFSLVQFQWQLTRKRAFSLAFPVERELLEENGKQNLATKKGFQIHHYAI